MRRQFRLASVMLFVSLLLQACGAHYYSILRKNSRDQQLYSADTFSAALMWDVVFLNPTMRNALWKYETEVMEKPAEIDSRILPASKVRGTQFIVSLYAPKNASTFSLDKNSFWSLKLDDGQSEYTPVAIEQLEKDVLFNRLIPYTYHWSKSYLVTFAGDFKLPFTLRMVGASGKSTIVWKVSKHAPLSQYP
ncbi:MAG: hypothetical protein COV45_02875 [Deltaproteobacteria bacterium CG11_big_fil_rev_8_21_14_0_20_47_16]|nr:MAG: hypothetical protein COV45_02875 [Deltaproteobacteria bacterium CG11_big_fil_rev_8_21_14_0_20_47_16]